MTTRPGAAGERRTGDGVLVLLVDDEALLRETMAEALVDLGYTVIKAADAPAALALLAQGARPDLLVTDLRLPGGLDGLQLAARLRDAWPGLPVLFITGDTQGLGETALAPRTEVLAKPFRLAMLARVVGALARGSRDP